jgi:uncharacterized protein YcnI
LASIAVAHVEISPKKVPADSFARFTIDVPTERKVPTVQLEVQLPPGLSSVKLRKKPGWKDTIRGGVATWSGGRIPPGHSAKFELKAHVPNTPGKELTFPALQTYADRKVVHWIGSSSSDTPVPTVTLEAAAITTTTTATSTGSGGNHHGIARAIEIALLIGLLTLGVVLFRRRRT